MFKQFIKKLEQRLPLEGIFERCNGIFQTDSSGQTVFSDEGFAALVEFLEGGEASYQALCVQAGARWSSSSQKVILRNTILQRGFLTPSCLWAYREMRGHMEELFREYPRPEMGLMQILLLKEANAAQAVPFLIEGFLARRDVPEELRAASRLCVLRLLDSGCPPDLVRSFQARYPRVEILSQWRPGIPGRAVEWSRGAEQAPIDFHQLVRSVHDVRELSSLTRALYLISLFYIPLTDREWRSLFLTRTDQVFFQRLGAAGIVESHNGGSILSTDAAKQKLVKKFLYESYSLAKDSVCRNRAERLKEERERRVRNSELDRQALEKVPEGIICVDGTGLLYYMNRPAEAMLNDNNELRTQLFGTGSLEEALRGYSREKILSRITASVTRNEDRMEVFGDRIAISDGGKRFEVELGTQVILMRETTDQYLIDQEIGKLYRHEMKAALDVMGVGLAGVKDLINGNQIEQAGELLDQVEEKRLELFAMLEERIDFIRLHSDAFQIRPSAVNVNMVVDKCLANYREAATGKGVRLESNHLQTSAVMVPGEERFLMKALDNVVRNAVKFCGTGAQITVTIDAEGSEAVVRIKDTGPGIPKEDLGKIFQLGFTTGGTGRGLYLARRITTAHGGRIEVSSQPDQGSCFTFRLPLLMEG